MNMPQPIQVGQGGRFVGRRRDAGFTLVELMVVIAIIGILASMLLGALNSASRTAKIARTKSLITKLHTEVMTRWETYPTRRLPISASQGLQLTGGAPHRLVVARRKMYALRELVRMEMPDRYDDLDERMFPLSYLIDPAGNPVRPALWHAYRQRIQSVNSSRGIDDIIKSVRDYNESAECLYLVVIMRTTDSRLASLKFSQSEVGDTDNDGMLEFIDAWGNPIEFLRWAPGFISEAQPMYSMATGEDRAKLFASSQPRDPMDPSRIISRWNVRMQLVADPLDPTNVYGRNAKQPTLLTISQNDPFNPLEVDIWQPGDNPPEYGYNLVPLIVSPGPDGESGLRYLRLLTPAAGNPKDPSAMNISNPYAYYRSARGRVAQRGEPTGGAHLDNIHNHLVLTGVR